MLASPQDWLVVAAVGFLLFGSKKLPEVAKSLGSSIVEFKKAMNDAMETKEEHVATPAAGQPAVTSPAQTAAVTPNPEHPTPAAAPTPERS